MELWRPENSCNIAINGKKDKHAINPNIYSVRKIFRNKIDNCILPLFPSHFFHLMHFIYKLVEFHLFSSGLWNEVLKI